MNMRYDDFMLPAGDSAATAARAEAAKQPRIHKMRPSIHVQLQVRHIEAASYAGAAAKAYAALYEDSTMVDALQKMGYETLSLYAAAARVAKEVDGTYTVTLP